MSRMLPCFDYRVMAAVASCLLFSSMAASWASESSLQLENATNATIRVELVSGGSDPPQVLTVLGPMRAAELTVPTGALVLALVAFKADPQRSHHIGLEVRPGEMASYRLIPHMMGLYLLEDAGGLSSTPILPSMNDSPAGDHVVEDPSSVCGSPDDTGHKAILWQTREQAQYYSVRGSFLCGATGEDLFATGPVYAHFICANGWMKCVRHQNGDFRILPQIRTSELIDTPLLLARRDDPAAGFTQTRQIVSMQPPVLEANLTEYFSFASGQGEAGCPDGYRLHYQGFCINVDDELADDPTEGVRGVKPSK